MLWDNWSGGEGGLVKLGQQYITNPPDEVQGSHQVQHRDSSRKSIKPQASTGPSANITAE